MHIRLYPSFPLSSSASKPISQGSKHFTDFLVHLFYLWTLQFSDNSSILSISGMWERKWGWICRGNRICRQTNWQHWWQSSTMSRPVGIWCRLPPWQWEPWKVGTTFLWLQSHKLRVYFKIHQSSRSIRWTNHLNLAGSRFMWKLWPEVFSKMFLNYLVVLVMNWSILEDVEGISCDIAMKELTWQVCWGL